RVTLIVLDSLGIGELADAENYGDKGANTFGHIADNMDSFHIPNLRKLGLGNIEGAAEGRFAVEQPEGAFGKLKEKSKGKDTITGHWEIAGLYTEIPFKTYPDGFPKAFMKAYEEAIGVETLGNYAASGTEIIEELGPEHEATGKPIVYTSADSVFQIAANTAVIPLNRLYEICEIARKMLVGDVACGRVIARPYIIDEKGNRTRTSERRDYAVSPSGKTVLDKVKAMGKTVYAIGKISDIFNGQGVTKSVHTDDNMDGVDKTIEALKEKFEGFIFTNLVDFDSKFGHRRDAKGYGKAIEEFDARLPEILGAMSTEDVLILCADHGNDPIHTGWDHTREHVPVVIYGKGIKQGIDLGVRESFADIGATIVEILGAEKTEIGESFLALIRA
ncbi:phosphopentomutase, partial [Aminipila sp.]|uniref:phosphopentomutase n=1 Tax=Aminipila sp. TaxID=2060095 RepID=UPI00289B44DA